MKITRYRKLMPPVVAVLAAVSEAIGDAELDGEELRTIGGAIAVAVFVWLLPNEPDSQGTEVPPDPE